MFYFDNTRKIDVNSNNNNNNNKNQLVNFKLLIVNSSQLGKQLKQLVVVVLEW